MSLKNLVSARDFAKIEKLKNSELESFIEKFIGVLKPSSVFISDSSASDIDYIRKKAVELGEEKKLKIEGHTAHFDNYSDQARDKANTKILSPKGAYLGASINTKDRDEGLKEIYSIMDGIMKGKEMIVSFYCLGPVNSPFSIPCVQITDSFYVAHNEILLYRQGYEEFLRQGSSAKFFKFVHSAGELLPDMTSKNIEHRRIYIDMEEETVYSANTQYGGNTIGLKKLAMRLAIHRASREGWLNEHMLVMGITGDSGRVTYVTGAFPSLCGKTSTSMIEGEKIVGDDIAYLRKINGEIRAANVEKGMFGIIQGINSKDDSIQWDVLTNPGEVIFSNVLLLRDGSVFWIGHNGEIPQEGFNHSGRWFRGKKDSAGREIPPSHPNARFTVSLDGLKNVDDNLHNPEGVPVGGVIYGGRDSDTSVPVEEAFDWVHGIITKGASLESETTAATLGKEGVRSFNPMSNLDFLSIPVGRYIRNNILFGQAADKPPKIFGVNYFLKDKNGSFLNERRDKKVWLKWIEKRINGELDAVPRPTGFIPRYKDLKKLFEVVLGKVYGEDEYEKQFTLRVNENISKVERILEIYSQLREVPAELFEVLKQQKDNLIRAKLSFGDYISPFIEIS